MWSYLTSLFAVIAVIATQSSNFFNRNSHTIVWFSKADENVIYVQARNTGRQQAVLRQYRLNLDALNIEPEKLFLTTEDLQNVMNVIPANGQARIGLIVRGLTPKQGFTRDQILQDVDEGSKNGILEIAIEESDGPRTKNDEFEAYQLRELIRNKLQERKDGK